MTCHELTSFLGDYFAGELEPEVSHAFDRHLSACPNCRQYLAEYRQTVALTRAVLDPADDAVPQDVPDGLVAAILAARRRDASG